MERPLLESCGGDLELQNDILVHAHALRARWVCAPLLAETGLPKELQALIVSYVDDVQEERGNNVDFEGLVAHFCLLMSQPPKIVIRVYVAPRAPLESGAGYEDKFIRIPVDSSFLVPQHPPLSEAELVEAVNWCLTSKMYFRDIILRRTLSRGASSKVYAAKEIVEQLARAKFGGGYGGTFNSGETDEVIRGCNRFRRFLGRFPVDCLVYAMLILIVPFLFIIFDQFFVLTSLRSRRLTQLWAWRSSLDEEDENRDLLRALSLEVEKARVETYNSVRGS